LLRIKLSYIGLIKRKIRNNILLTIFTGNRNFDWSLVPTTAFNISSETPASSSNYLWQ